MKCKACNGTGIDDDRLICCGCGGTGEYEPFDLDVELDKLYPTEMTNEEYIRSMNAEELATFLAVVQYDGTDLTLKKNHVEKWVEWLKEIHHADRS